MARPTIVILGSAGSGKGTQAELIKEQMGYKIVEAGKIFRAKGQEDSDLGREVKRIYESGEHAPDELITDIMRDFIKEVPVKDPLLIDGYPRTVGQAELLKKLLKEDGREPENVVVVWINVRREEVERRLLNRSQCTVCKTVFMQRENRKCPHCNGEVKPRAYDKPEAIKKRLDFFQDKVMNLIEMYKKKGKLVEINGEQEVVQVFKQIKNELEPLLKLDLPD